MPVTPAGKAGLAKSSRLSADAVRYEGGLIILEGNAERPARFLSSTGEIIAQKVQVDTEKQTIEASGNVIITRTKNNVREVLRPSNLPRRFQQETATETLSGDNFTYNFKTRIGQLNNAALEMTDFDLNVATLTINGEKYVAHNVVLRLGGQTPAEDKIYGVPPLNVRARRIELTVPRDGDKPNFRFNGAALYFKNTRLLPVPSFAKSISNSRSNSAFSLTPRLSINSADGVLLTTEIRFPLDKTANGLAFVTDLGASAQLGFRGGAALELNNQIGRLALRGQVQDIVTTQLTNRIKLDRLPEISYFSSPIALFKLPGNRRTGLRLEGSWGDYREELINTPGNTKVSSSRGKAGVHFTTRLRNSDRSVPDGPYLDLFASTSHYSLGNLSYRAAGYEIGYDSQFTSKWSGAISYRDTSLSGATPFRFDVVEIPREVRATLDYRYSPRYILPLDLRYDLNRREVRDATFGLLRAYKTFAYGLTYNTAHNSFQFQFRY